MKKYKTWEVIKMLSENPELKFEGSVYTNNTKTDIKGYAYVEESTGNIVLIDELGRDGGFRINEEWTLIQQPVPFMEAVKAYDEGKIVRCVLPGAEYIFKCRERLHGGRLYVAPVSTSLAITTITTKMILKGIWYIEEQEA